MDNSTRILLEQLKATQQAAQDFATHGIPNLFAGITKNMDLETAKKAKAAFEQAQVDIKLDGKIKEFSEVQSELDKIKNSIFAK